MGMRLSKAFVKYKLTLWMEELDSFIDQDIDQDVGQKSKWPNA